MGSCMIHAHTLTTPCGGSLADQPAKDAAEMRLIKEAAELRDFGQWNRSLQHDLRGARRALLHHVHVGRLFECAPE